MVFITVITIMFGLHRGDQSQDGVRIRSTGKQNLAVFFSVFAQTDCLKLYPVLDAKLDKDILVNSKSEVIFCL